MCDGDTPRLDPHRCACGLRYTEEEWNLLKCPGVMCLESGYSCELRDCHCGSTMARILRPVTAEVQAYLDGVREADAA